MTRRSENASAEVDQAVEAKKHPKKKSSDGSNEYKVIVPLLNVREKASMASEVIGTLLEGETVHISARTPQGFGKLDGEGYVKLEFVEKADEAGEPE